MHTHKQDSQAIVLHSAFEPRFERRDCPKMMLLAAFSSKFDWFLNVCCRSGRDRFTTWPCLLLPFYRKEVYAKEFKITNQMLTCI